jgi:hypothetical protein
MTVEKSGRNSSAGANKITVSESAKRQISAKASAANAHLAGPNLGPSFFEGFPETTLGPNREN